MGVLETRAGARPVASPQEGTGMAAPVWCRVAPKQGGTGGVLGAALEEGRRRRTGRRSLCVGMAEGAGRE